MSDFTEVTKVGRLGGKRTERAAGAFVRWTWWGLVVYLAFSVSAVTVKSVKGDQRYFCQYSIDCRGNAWARRCCRDIGGLSTGVYRCAGSCR